MKSFCQNIWGKIHAAVDVIPAWSAFSEWDPMACLIGPLWGPVEKGPAFFGEIPWKQELNTTHARWGTRYLNWLICTLCFDCARIFSPVHICCFHRHDMIVVGTPHAYINVLTLDSVTPTMLDWTSEASWRQYIHWVTDDWVSDLLLARIVLARNTQSSNYLVRNRSRVEDWLILL